MMAQYCPSCGDEVVLSSGNPSCDYLIIEEFPELILPAPSMSYQNRYQKEEWTPKKILANELAKVGMNVQQFYMLSVYPHSDNSPTPNETCYDWGIEQVIERIPEYRGIIILGGNLCKFFTDYELKQVQGLSSVSSQYLPDGDIPRVFLPTLRSIYSTGAGEFRLGLERFVSQLQGE